MTTRASEIDRYIHLISRLIAPSMPFVPEIETDTLVQIERATLFPLLSIGRAAANDFQRMNQLASRPVPGANEVLDRLGHRRPAYRGLLVYSWLRAIDLLNDFQAEAAHDVWKPAIQSGCRRLHVEIARPQWPTGLLPATFGGTAVRAIWESLALRAAADRFAMPEWGDAARDVMRRVAKSRSLSGSFLTPGPADNLESFWYDELAILHAVASFAAQWPDELSPAIARQAAEYHARETQPDNATQEPWGLLAFILNERARSLADQMLHSVSVLYPGGAIGVTSLLLADVLYCLRL